MCWERIAWEISKFPVQAENDFGQSQERKIEVDEGSRKTKKEKRSEVVYKLLEPIVLKRG